ncbi:MAG: hypothetical protein EOP61_37955 [Sphingomonadales bacterium]|nr:MAG: hypothetical protein EOP61_37955 [Sphingomonadales bacterium]
MICAVMALIMARQLCEVLFTSIGLPKVNLMVQLQSSLLSLGGVALGANLGLIPVAIGWSFRALPFISSSAWLMREYAGIGLDDQWRALRGPLLAASVMALGMTAAVALAPAYQSAGLRLLWLIPLGVVLYAAALLAIDPVARADGFAAVRWLRHRGRTQSSGS